MTQQFPAVQPHGSLEPIFEDVWYVTGSVVFKPLLGLPRNMVILRHGGLLESNGPTLLRASIQRELT